MKKAPWKSWEGVDLSFCAFVGHSSSVQSYPGMKIPTNQCQSASLKNTRPSPALGLAMCPKAELRFSGPRTSGVTEHAVGWCDAQFISGTSVQHPADCSKRLTAAKKGAEPRPHKRTPHLPVVVLVHFLEPRRANHSGPACPHQDALYQGHTLKGREKKAGAMGFTGLQPQMSPGGRRKSSSGPGGVSLQSQFQNIFDYKAWALWIVCSAHEANSSLRNKFPSEWHEEFTLSEKDAVQVPWAMRPSYVSPTVAISSHGASSVKQAAQS